MARRERYLRANTNPYESNYNFIPYVQAPSTAHVLWRRLGTIDGIVGAGNYQESYGGAPGGIQTLPVANNPTLIYDGRCYTTLSKVMDGISQSVWECYDLRTGQIYWDQVNVTHPPTSISYETGAPIVAGGSAKQSMLTVSLLYIGSGMMTKYNPFTGAITYNISLSPLTSGTVFANNYVLSVQTIGSGASAKYYLVNWTDITEIQRGVNPTWAQRIQSNISWPINTVPSTSDYQVGVTATVSSITISGAYAGINVTGISLITGQVLWSTNTTEPIYSGSCAVADQGKIAVLTEAGHWLAWDLLTGRLAWTGQEMDLPWGASAFGGYACQSAYGLFYWEAYDGVYAYNWTNGQIAWHFLSPAPYPYETYYQDGNTTVYPFDQGAIVADGKIYTYNIEHSAISPLTRGWKIFCINATTGAGIWNMTNPSAVGGISDGYMSATSVYDGYQYIFGKGQSTTTVSAPQTQITTGQNAIISGTVLDKSPGDLGSYSNPTARTDFPTYVPCVSDESMQTYMDYLYMQLPIPSGVTVTGVPVSIDAVDPNGNFMHIATVTSDVSGTYSYTWTPTISGDYKITATFVGTDAYGSSFAEAHANVVNAPTTSPTPTPTISGLATTSDLMTYIVVGVIAIIIAIAIATILILKKHP